jgi:hypothetical protein
MAATNITKHCCLIKIFIVNLRKIASKYVVEPHVRTWQVLVLCKIVIDGVETKDDFFPFCDPPRTMRLTNEG